MRTFIALTFIAVAVIGCAKSDEPLSPAADVDQADETNATTDAATEEQPAAAPPSLDPPAEPSAEPPAEPSTEAPVAPPAEPTAEPVGVGQPAPSFEGLAGVDDQKHSLKDFADAKAVVVVFTCNKCPVAVAYEDRLIGLQKDYADKGVKLVAINVNNDEADKLPAMKERAEQKGFTFPYVYDPTQKVARDYGAEVTPHIFLLDGERRLAYVGPIDDNMDESQVKQHYLRDAIDAVLAGNKPETTEAKAVGCGIQYETTAGI